LTNPALYQQIEQQLPVFYRSWWLDAVCAGSWDVAINQDEQGKVLAVMPYHTERKMGFSLLRLPTLTPYLGPYFFYPAGLKEGQARWDWEEDQVNALLPQLPECDYYHFHSLPGFANFLPFLHKGFSNANRMTYRIDLQQSEEQMLEKMQKRRRRYIRNADKSLEVVDGTPYLEQFFALHRRTFEKKKEAYQYSRPFLERLMQEGTKQQSAAFWAVLQDGQPQGMLWVVYDQQCMYQLLSAYTETQTNHAAISLLTWHAITEAKKMGLATFDFEGSIHPGIEPFFRKFGGDRVIYLAFERYRSRLWKWKKMILG
jgi:hypothetical protein